MGDILHPFIGRLSMAITNDYYVPSQNPRVPAFHTQAIRARASPAIVCVMAERLIQKTASEDKLRAGGLDPGIGRR